MGAGLQSISLPVVGDGGVVHGGEPAGIGEEVADKGGPGLTPDELRNRTRPLMAAKLSFHMTLVGKEVEEQAGILNRLPDLGEDRSERPRRELGR